MLLAGTAVPVILRPRGEEYHYVEPAYFYEIMNGEAWPAGGCADAMSTFALV